MGYYSEAGSKIANNVSSPIATGLSYMMAQSAIAGAQKKADQGKILNEGEALRKEQLGLDVTQEQAEKEFKDKSKEVELANQTVIDAENDILKGSESATEAMAKNYAYNMAKNDYDMLSKSLQESYKKTQSINKQREVFNATLKDFKTRAQGAFGKNWEKKVNKGGWMK